MWNYSLYRCNKHFIHCVPQRALKPSLLTEYLQLLCVSLEKHQNAVCKYCCKYVFGGFIAW